MNLTEKINTDLKTAMLARDEAKTRTLRSIKSAFLLLATAEGNADVNDEAAIKAIQKLAKQRRDSIEIFAAQNREDLVKKEKEELEVIEQYLPKQMEEGEVKAALQSIIERVGAKSPADTGKVMGVAMKELAGKADGKMISTVLKSLLS